MIKNGVLYITADIQKVIDVPSLQADAPIERVTFIVNKKEDDWIFQVNLNNRWCYWDFGNGFLHIKNIEYWCDLIDFTDDDREYLNLMNSKKIKALTNNKGLQIKLLLRGF